MFKHAFRFTVVASVALAASVAPMALSANTAERIVDPAQSSVSPADGMPAATLVEFNYDAFFDRATQLGLLTQKLGYTLMVSPEGKATDCKLSRTFRSRFTNKELCKAVMRNATLSPAVDAAGNPVAGTYKGEVQVWSFFQADR
jgi:periplasmic protein TonB